MKPFNNNNNKKKPILNNSTNTTRSKQLTLSNFFTSTKPIKSITTPEKVSLVRQDSFLNKTINSNTGFEDLSSPDTSFDTSIEINNFRNPILSQTISQRKTTTTAAPKVNTKKNPIILSDDEDDLDVIRYYNPKPKLHAQSQQPTLKRANSDFLDILNGQPKKVPKLLSRTSSILSENSGSNITNSTKLSVEQETVIQAVVYQKQNVFYTGSAGTGKSVVLRELVKKLREIYRDQVGITASTGMAACNIQGQTLHKFLGIGLGLGSAFELSKRIKRNPMLLRKWQMLKVLIIDEISMIDGLLFEKLEQIAKIVRGNTKPFGGIQIVCTGDFFQLPPVSKDGKSKFCFQANCWTAVIKRTILLKQVFRQKGDNELIDMLNALRSGTLTPEIIAKFSKLSRSVTYEDGIEPTELFPTRDQVKTANFSRLNQLKGKPIIFPALDNVSSPDYKKQLDNLMCEQTLTLKEGAQVMNLKNIDDDLVNGSIGTVLTFLTPRLHMQFLEHYGKEIDPTTDHQILSELRFLSSRIANSDSYTATDSAFFDQVPEERKSIFQQLCHIAVQESTANLLPLIKKKTSPDKIISH